MLLLLLLGIVLGLVVIPLVVWLALLTVMAIDRWRHPQPDPFWKPGKPRGR